mmetsp:Transcript_31584/g.48997  ORF Transcript_31584/g.48997 Transcript_31584/m.48997 type:complete len:106 (+) Transcript_31584:336-653(+)
MHFHGRITAAWAGLGVSTRQSVLAYSVMAAVPEMCRKEALEHEKPAVWVAVMVTLDALDTEIVAVPTVMPAKPDSEEAVTTALSAVNSPMPTLDLLLTLTLREPT